MKLATNRLLLRKLEKTDWEMISFLRTDPRVKKYIDRPTAETKEKAMEFINMIENDTAKQISYYWVLSQKDNPKMIGSICLWNLSEDRKTAEVGYDLSPDFQGKGFMNEALSAVIEFGFKQLKLNSIKAFTHRENEPSKKLLERNKFELVMGEIDSHNENNIIYVLKG